MTSRHPLLALALLAFAQMIIVVDFSIVFIALPSIGTALGFNAYTLQWVVSAYTLLLGGFLLLGGRAADLLGRRRMFIIALWVYACSTLAGGLAVNQEMLIIARAVQGLGGALLFPTTVSIVNTTFTEGPERNRALGIWGGAGASGGALGVLLGGILTSTLGWEWVLFVNVPFAAGAALLAPWLLPKDPPSMRTWRAILRSFDGLGAIMITLTCLLLVYGLIQGPVVGWTTYAVILPLAGSVLAGATFLIIEANVAVPLVPFVLFKNRTLLAAVLVAVAFTAVFGSQLYLLNLWLQHVRGLNAFAAALAVVPLSVSSLIGTQLARILATRLGARTTLTVGLLIGATGLLCIALRLSVAGDYASLLVPAILVSGIGQGSSYTALWILASSGVRREHAGVASGITATAQQIGAPIGLSLLVAIANQGQPLAGDPVLRQQLNSGLQTAFILTTAIAIAAAISVLLLVPRDPRNAP